MPTKRRAASALTDGVNENEKQPPREPKRDRNGFIRCRVCGCTEVEACNPPCSWSEADLCSNCNDAVDALHEWFVGAHRPSRAALLRELDRLMASSVVPPDMRRLRERRGAEGDPLAQFLQRGLRAQRAVDAAVRTAAKSPGALIAAVKVIQVWHNLRQRGASEPFGLDGAWKIYWRNSPEMASIREALVGVNLDNPEAL